MAAGDSAPAGMAQGELFLANRHIPERSCVACGQKLPKRGLIRVVRTPQGEVKVDLTGKGAGRGAYLCWSTSCWERGMRKGGLERSLHSPLSAQDSEQLQAFFHQAAAGIAVESNR